MVKVVIPGDGSVVTGRKGIRFFADCIEWTLPSGRFGGMSAEEYVQGHAELDREQGIWVMASGPRVKVDGTPHKVFVDSLSVKATPEQAEALLARAAERLAERRTEEHRRHSERMRAIAEDERALALYRQTVSP